MLVSHYTYLCTTSICDWIFFAWLDSIEVLAWLTPTELPEKAVLVTALIAPTVVAPRISSAFGCLMLCNVGPIKFTIQPCTRPPPRSQASPEGPINSQVEPVTGGPPRRFGSCRRPVTPTVPDMLWPKDVFMAPLPPPPPTPQPSPMAPMGWLDLELANMKEEWIPSFLGPSNAMWSKATPEGRLEPVPTVSVLVDEATPPVDVHFSEPTNRPERHTSRA